MTHRYLSYSCLLLASLAGESSVWGFSAGAPAGYAGAPADSTCVACHSNTLNSGGGTLSITFPDSNGWVAGQKYRLRVTLQDPAATRWGFELTNRKDAT